MNIQPINTPIQLSTIKLKAQQPNRVPTSSATPSPERTKTNDQMESLRSEPDVRPAELSRAQAMVNDPNYPSDDILSKVAEILINDPQPPH